MSKLYYGLARSMNFTLASVPFPLQVHGGNEGARADVAHMGLCHT